MVKSLKSQENLQFVAGSHWCFRVSLILVPIVVPIVVPNANAGSEGTANTSRALFEKSNHVLDLSFYFGRHLVRINQSRHNAASNGCFRLISHLVETIELLAWTRIIRMDLLV